ncbi:MAG: endonuclease III domain-containing protein [Nitrospirae bacterium]|nr:endonuclease III domain-containing protein [Nitrospirota bacterium]
MKHRDKLLEIYAILFKAFGHQHWWPGDTPFEIAVGAILTQNTNWGNVIKAINNLKAKDLLNAYSINTISHDELAAAIRPSGYFNIKAKRLKSFISLLVNDFDGEIENMAQIETMKLRKQLLDVNGIGPETADSILLYAVNKAVFVVDVYTRRVISRHGLMDYNSSYDEFQRLFHDNLDTDIKLYNEFHALFVMTGKYFCKPKANCYGNKSCPLNVNLSHLSSSLSLLSQ